MKVHHEEKDVGQQPMGRTDSKKSKLFKRKLAIKGAKSKEDKRKSAPAGMILSDLTSREYENLETMASNFLHNDEALAVIHMTRIGPGVDHRENLLMIAQDDVFPLLVLLQLHRQMRVEREESQLIQY